MASLKREEDNLPVSRLDCLARGVGIEGPPHLDTLHCPPL